MKQQHGYRIPDTWAPLSQSRPVEDEPGSKVMAWIILAFYALVCLAALGGAAWWTL